MNKIKNLWVTIRQSKIYFHIMLWILRHRKYKYNKKDMDLKWDIKFAGWSDDQIQEYKNKEIMKKV